MMLTPNSRRVRFPIQTYIQRATERGDVIAALPIQINELNAALGGSFRRTSLLPQFDLRNGPSKRSSAI
ncbi:hypothetical protein [Candidatus Villigracilis affinis]|uniref:hypothetical protein n=1 Tax=Candidatus Villigracilis affinis TaxID=3140682 RepID=UPI001DD24BC8|nr:hypothetical protein [Anaerolineales bacterium]